MDIRMEALSLFSTNDSSDKYKFHHAQISDKNRMFKYGCDAVQLRFEKDFEAAFNG